MTRRSSGRAGFTLMEMLIALTAGTFLTISASSIFLMNQRGLERQTLVRDVQSGIHVTVERLIGLIRNATAIDETSTQSRLVIQGGQASTLCGATSCWIEVASGGLRSGPVGGAAADGRMIAPNVTSMTVSFGLDDSNDGRIDTFSNTIPAGRGPDVLAVRIALESDASTGRSAFHADSDFVAVLRTPVIARISPEP